MGIAHLTHEVPRHVVDVDGALIFPGPRRLPGLGDYRSVRADPLAGCEATWLPHLHAGRARP